MPDRITIAIDAAAAVLSALLAVMFVGFMVMVSVQPEYRDHPETRQLIIGCLVATITLAVAATYSAVSKSMQRQEVLMGLSKPKSDLAQASQK